MTKRQYLFALGLFLCYRLTYKTTPAPGYYLVKRYWFYLVLVPVISVILLIMDGIMGFTDNFNTLVKNETHKYYTLTEIRYKEFTFTQKLTLLSYLWFE